MRQQTKLCQKESTNVGVAEATILMGAKHAPLINMAIKMRPTTTIEWAESKKGCKWQLGATMNKLEISNPLINFMDTPPNPTGNNMLAIPDSGASIHTEKQATTKMSPVIMSN